MLTFTALNESRQVQQEITEAQLGAPEVLAADLGRGSRGAQLVTTIGMVVMVVRPRLSPERA
jgi:hypothetical protein